MAEFFAAIGRIVFLSDDSTGILVKMLTLFPFIAVLYYAIPVKRRPILLLISGWLIYLLISPYILSIVVITTIIAYITAKQGSKHLIISGSVFYFLILILGKGFLPQFQTILFVGLSFFILRLISYLIDVYKKSCEPEKDFIVFAAWAAFFPLILAGPITRAKQVIPHFRKKYKADYYDITDGLRLMAWGFFKKFIIANRAITIVDSTFININSSSGVALIFAAVLFVFWLYTELSGLTEIARGMVQVLGFDIPSSFDRSYSARSVSAFWRRFNMSFSQWIKEYIYIPLGGNRAKPMKWVLNITIVFILASTWYGISPQIMLLTMISLLAIMLQKLSLELRFKAMKGKKPLIVKAMDSIITFIFFLTTLILLRVENIGSWLYILQKVIVEFSVADIISLAKNTDIIILYLSIGTMCVCEFVDSFLLQKEETYGDLPPTIRWSGYIFWTVSLLLFAVI